MDILYNVLGRGLVFVSHISLMYVFPKIKTLDLLPFKSAHCCVCRLCRCSILLIRVRAYPYYG